MFLPLGDEPNPRGVPVVTYTLIGLNIAVFLFVTLPLSAVRPALDDPALAEYLRAIGPRLSGRMELAALLQQVSAYDLVVFSYGFRPADPSVIALLTALFLHGGFMHLAGNMLFLWIYGDNVEHRLGPARYLVAYLGTGVLATLSHAVLDLESTVPMVGASGAISGVLGFYFIWFPRNRVRLWIMLFPIFMNVVYAPARLVLGMYLIVDNLLPFLVTRGAGGGGVAYGAHIGGFLGGLAYAWWSARREVGRRPEDFEPDPDPAEPAFDPDPSSVRGVRQLIAAGEHGRAAAEYFRLSAARTARLLLPGDSIGFGRWLANNGHPDAALVVYQRHLRDYPLGPYAAEAHLGAGLVQLHARDQPTAAYQHLAAVLDADPHPETEGYARRALTEIAARQKFRTPGVH
jgi:membrane associated rhomboid family serine protease